MKRKTIITILLALVTMEGLAQKKIAEVKADSLLLLVQAGDSCMSQYNTFEALSYYKKAYDIGKGKVSIETEETKIPLDQLEQFENLPPEQVDEIIQKIINGASISDICDRCKVSLSAAMGELFV